MTAAIKICGIGSLADAELAIEHGAQYLGFIFVPSSARHIEPNAARSIIDSLKTKIETVGVFQNATTDEIEKIDNIVGLNYVQLHGNESADLCASLPKPVIKAFQLANNLIEKQPCLTLSFRDQKDIAKSLQTLDRYRPYCNHFLFDKAKSDFSDNWLEPVIVLLSSIEAKLDKYWLAGGLNSKNIDTVLQKLKPDVIDIASSLEESPGKKSKNLMSEFFSIVQQIQGAQASPPLSGAST